MTIYWRRQRSASIAVIFSTIGVFLTLSFSYGCTSEKSDAKPLGRSAAIALAKAELAKHGYPVGEMVIEADETNQKWVSYLRSTPDSAKHFKNELAELEGRRYWAVYFKPAPIPNTVIMGGDAFVFVETASGAILSVILFR